MEKRLVRFENVQDALLWLMSNRYNKENEARLYDEFGNYVIHSSYNNVIEYYHYEIDFDENGNDVSFWDFERISYEEFINKFENIVLKNY